MKKEITARAANSSSDHVIWYCITNNTALGEQKKLLGGSGEKHCQGETVENDIPPNSEYMLSNLINRDHNIHCHQNKNKRN